MHASRFEGRVCVVTGGGRGIGRAIALGLAAEGGAVAVAARTRWQCEEVAGQMLDLLGERILGRQETADRRFRSCSLTGLPRMKSPGENTRVYQLTMSGSA